MENRMEDLYIAGVGVYLPEPEPAENAVHRGHYSPVVAATDEIHSARVEPELFPAEMAALAGREALTMAGTPPATVRAVFHSYLDYQGAPYWDAAPYVAVNTVGASVPAFDVRQACNGAMGSIELGRGFLRDSTDSVLITTGDRFDGSWVNRWHGDQSVFGDGGAGMVLTRGSGFARVVSLVTVADNSLEAECRGGRFGDLPTATIDFDMRRDAYHKTTVPIMEHYTRLEAALKSCIERALHNAEAKPGELAYVVPVTTTKWRMHTLLDRYFNLDIGRSTWEFGQTTGHLGPGDQIAGLHYLRATEKVGRGDRLLLLGGGTGYTVTSAVIEIVEDV